jgi:bifunctional enzyme CysN/CysC/sulfate adenylyltransferase subunit 1
MVLQGGQVTTVKEIHTYDGPVAEAFCPQSITLLLEHDLDISRGNMIVAWDHHLPGASAELRANLCWMHPRPLQAGRKYWLKHTTHNVQVVVTSLAHRLNISTFETEPAPAQLALNDIGEISLRTASPLYFDGYETNRLTGSFILIEPGTHATVGAGMLFPPTEVARPESAEFAI